MDGLVPKGVPGVIPSAAPNRSWIKYVVIAVVILIAFVGLIVSCAFSIGGPAMKAGEVFLTQITAGQVDAAYESAAAKFKETVPKDVFAKFVKEFPIATKVKSVSFNSFSIENSIAEIHGTITTTDGQTGPVNMTLVDENNVWKVQYVDFLTEEQIAANEAAYQQEMQRQAEAQQSGQQQGAQQPGEVANPVPAEGGTEQVAPAVEPAVESAQTQAAPL